MVRGTRRRARRPDRMRRAARWRVLERSARPGAKRVVDVVVHVEGRQHDDLACVPVRRRGAAGCLDPVDPGMRRPSARRPPARSRAPQPPSVGRLTRLPRSRARPRGSCGTRGVRAPGRRRSHAEAHSGGQEKVGPQPEPSSAWPSSSRPRRRSAPPHAEKPVPAAVPSQVSWPWSRILSSSHPANTGRPTSACSVPACPRSSALPARGGRPSGRGRQGAGWIVFSRGARPAGLPREPAPLACSS